jgi:DNA polymerase III epsilon subunit-like protein
MNPEKPETVDLALVPYITQLSFIVYDTETRLITHIFDEYIDIPDDVYISDKITSITSIDRDVLNAKGIPMFYALSVFLQCLKHCDCLVAHNIAFDVRMIRFEMMRYAFCQTGVFDRSMDGPFGPLTLYCTMRNGQSICKLKTATGWAKPPKLCELYFHLFHETVENLHNSIIDVLVCFRCFLKIAYSHHIPPNVFGKFMNFDYEAMYESLETDHSAIVCL